MIVSLLRKIFLGLFACRLVDQPVLSRYESSAEFDRARKGNWS
jgi:hypothetical protein